MKNKKVIGFILAGTMVLSNTAFAAETVNKTKELQTVPISAKIPFKEEVKVVTAKEIKSKGELVEYDVDIPKVQGLGDILYQEQLNKLIMDNAMNYINELEEQAKDWATEAERQGLEIRPFGVYIDYDVKANSDILSFTITSYAQTGGTGFPIVDCYNIDVRQSKNVELKDLFEEDANYKTIINEEITKQITAQTKQEDKIYFEGDDGFTTISDTQSYYIQDNNIVIVFPKYSIAPGYMGTPEFRIPFVALDKLSGLIKVEQESKLPKSPATLSVFDKIIINNTEVMLENDIYKNENGTVMIPLRQVSESLGYKVTWNDQKKYVELSKGAYWMYVKPGMDDYNFARMILKLGAVPETKHDRIYVPLDFAKEILKMDVYISNSGLINIMEEQ